MQTLCHLYRSVYILCHWCMSVCIYCAICTFVCVCLCTYRLSIDEHNCFQIFKISILFPRYRHGWVLVLILFFPYLGWLEDAALFAAIDHSVDKFSWYGWPEPLKNRHLCALEDIYQNHKDFVGTS